MVYIFLANGFEELEAIAPLDILKRGGLSVETVGVGNDLITSAGGLKVKTDLQIKNIRTDNLECIILPGGMPGTTNLSNDKEIPRIINFCTERNILIGAICAAPIILGKMGLLKNKKACCYPGFEENLREAKVSENNVCIDGNIITSKGPGTAVEFGFELLRCLKDEQTVKEVKNNMQYFLFNDCQR